MENHLKLSFQIYTDGGATRLIKSPKEIPVVNSSSSNSKNVAGSAAIIIGPDKQKQKLVAFLGDASDAEAEIWAGMLGLSYIHNIVKNNKASVTWYCDNKVVLETATKLLATWQICMQ